MTTTATVLLVGFTGTAAVGTTDGWGRKADELVASPDATDGSVAVSVRVEGTTVEGEPVTASRQVKVPPVCWYTRWLSGREYFAFWTGERFQAALAQMPPQYRTQALPGYEQHQDDTEGAWYVTRCRPDAGLEQIQAFDASHPPTYWTPADPVPATRYDVDVRELVEVAYDLTVLPTGTVRWNPQVGEVGATWVGLETWVWIEGAPTQVSARAEVDAGSTWAQVDAVLERVEVSAPGAEPVSCAGAGTPWSPDAGTPSCALVFARSSADQPVQPGHAVPTSTVTARAVWTAAWTSSLSDVPQELETQEVVVTAEIPVAETQTLTTVG